MHFPSEEEDDTYSCTKVIAQDGVFLARPYLLLWRTYLYPLPGGQPLTFGPRLLLLLLCVFSHAKAARRQAPLSPSPPPPQHSYFGSHSAARPIMQLARLPYKRTHATVPTKPCSIFSTLQAWARPAGDDKKKKIQFLNPTGGRGGGLQLPHPPRRRSASTP